MLTAVKTILIVDDDPDIVRALQGALERHGFRTDIAMDGKEALEKIERKTPDLILLDLMLPEISGETVCKTIKKNEKLKNIPVIMVTGKCSDTDRVIGRVIGAEYYLKKPCDVGLVLKTIEQVFLLPN